MNNFTDTKQSGYIKLSIKRKHFNDIAGCRPLLVSAEHTNEIENKIFIIIFLLQRPNEVVAIKAIAKKNLAKSQNLLGKEIKILKVSTLVVNNCMFY